MRVPIRLCVVMALTALLASCVVHAEAAASTAANATTPYVKARSVAAAECAFSLVASPFTGSGATWSDSVSSNGQNCKSFQPWQINGWFSNSKLTRLGTQYSSGLTEYHGSTSTSGTPSEVYLNDGEFITSVTLFVVPGATYISGFSVVTTQNAQAQVIGSKPQGANTYIVPIDSQQRVGIFTGLADTTGIGGLGVGQVCLTCLEAGQ